MAPRSVSSVAFSALAVALCVAVLAASVAPAHAERNKYSVVERSKYLSPYHKEPAPHHACKVPEVDTETFKLKGMGSIDIKFDPRGPICKSAAAPVDGTCIFRLKDRPIHIAGTPSHQTYDDGKPSRLYKVTSVIEIDLVDLDLPDPIPPNLVFSANSYCVINVDKTKKDAKKSKDGKELVTARCTSTFFNPPEHEPYSFGPLTPGSDMLIQQPGINIDIEVSLWVDLITCKAVTDAVDAIFPYQNVFGSCFFGKVDDHGTCQPHLPPPPKQEPYKPYKPPKKTWGRAEGYEEEEYKPVVPPKKVSFPPQLVAQIGGVAFAVAEDDYNGPVY